MTLRRHNYAGAFTKVELMVALSMAALAVLLIFPAFRIPVRHAPMAMCLSQLKQIGTATAMYASEHGEMLPTQERSKSAASQSSATNVADYLTRLLPYVGHSARVWQCPADVERYKAGKDERVWKLLDQQISYSVNLDALPNATSIFLTDRNITNNAPLPKGSLMKLDGNRTVHWGNSLHAINYDMGNILFGDCHVETMEASAVRDLIRNSPTNSVRLLLPQ